MREPSQHAGFSILQRMSHPGGPQEVLVLGDYRQTVTAVRSLARAGFAVILGTSVRRSSTALSRHVSEVWRYGRADSGSFCDELESFLRVRKPAFVLPLGESQLRPVIREAARLEPLSCWAMPEPETVARCLDKSALYALTPTLGIPTPASRVFTTEQDWRREAATMGFPVVVKRKDSSAQVCNRKAMILRTAPELDEFLRDVGSDPDRRSLVLQKFAAGTRHNCHVAAADGRLTAYFEQKVIRTDELDDTGIGVAGASVAPSPELRGYCERLLLALRYTGIGCIQFLVDGARAAFLEFNPRMDSTAMLPYRLGLDFPLFAIELAANRRARNMGLDGTGALREPSALEAPYPVGKRYHWLCGDLGAWIECLRRRRQRPRELATWALDMLWRSALDSHLTWDVFDPLPTLHMFWKKYGQIALRRPPRARLRQA